MLVSRACQNCGSVDIVANTGMFVGKTEVLFDHCNDCNHGIPREFPFIIIPTNKSIQYTVYYHSYQEQCRHNKKEPVIFAEFYNYLNRNPSVKKQFKSEPFFDPYRKKGNFLFGSR